VADRPTLEKAFAERRTRPSDGDSKTRWASAVSPDPAVAAGRPRPTVQRASGQAGLGRPPTPRSTAWRSQTTASSSPRSRPSTTVTARPTTLAGLTAQRPLSPASSASPGPRPYGYSLWEIQGLRDQRLDRRHPGPDGPERSQLRRDHREQRRPELDGFHGQRRASAGYDILRNGQPGRDPARTTSYNDTGPGTGHELQLRRSCPGTPRGNTLARQRHGHPRRTKSGGTGRVRPRPRPVDIAERCTRERPETASTRRPRSSST